MNKIIVIYIHNRDAHKFLNDLRFRIESEAVSISLLPEIQFKNLQELELELKNGCNQKKVSAFLLFGSESGINCSLPLIRNCLSGYGIEQFYTFEDRTNKNECYASYDARLSDVIDFLLEVTRGK